MHEIMRGLQSNILYVWSFSLLYDRRWSNLPKKQFSCKVYEHWNLLTIPCNAAKSAPTRKLCHPRHAQACALSYEILSLMEDKVMLFSSFGCACVFTWSWWCWSFVRHISLNTLFFSPWIFRFFLLLFPLSFQRDLLFLLYLRERPLESLGRVTADFIFQGPPYSYGMSCSLQVLFSSWWEKITSASESWGHYQC